MVVVKWSLRSPTVSDDPSLSPAEDYSFLLENLVEEHEKKKEKEVRPIFQLR